ncbi:helix-turn-helix domain-containing protein [Ruminococcus albus]|uniref:Helix-turn-helix n=1 Tax=Ruminococcus albus TaxID=1264 RepID=A0A1H7MCL0_RUMAL|nr:helix-turn-helix transcriptional regulator [Ruminococcus albus]SEL08799.1 Helix-turn-helix [Ruminococcus albus]
MIAKRLKEARKKAKLSQEKVAELLNTSRSNISKYENGNANPDLDIFAELCKIYNVSADEILGIERETYTNNYNISSHDNSTQNININNK